MKGGGEGGRGRGGGSGGGGRGGVGGRGGGESSNRFFKMGVSLGKRSLMGGVIFVMPITLTMP